MTRGECPFEDDVLAAVQAGRWPRRADETLRAHVASCVICTDLTVVVAAFDAECAAMEACGPLTVPESGVMWWRAQMRARQDATRAAGRPISAAQAVGFAVAVGVAGAVFGATASWFQQGLHWISGAFRTLFAFRLPLPSASLFAAWSGYSLWLLAAVVCLVLTPLVLYLATQDD